MKNIINKFQDKYDIPHPNSLTFDQQTELREISELFEKYAKSLSLAFQYVPAVGKNEYEEKELQELFQLIKEMYETEKQLLK